MARTVKKVRLTDNTQKGTDGLPIVLHPEIEPASTTELGGIKLGDQFGKTVDDKLVLIGKAPYTQWKMRRKEFVDFDFNYKEQFGIDLPSLSDFSLNIWIPSLFTGPADGDFFDFTYKDTSFTLSNLFDDRGGASAQIKINVTTDFDGADEISTIDLDVYCNKMAMGFWANGSPLTKKAQEGNMYHYTDSFQVRNDAVGNCIVSLYLNPDDPFDVDNYVTQDSEITLWGN